METESGIGTLTQMNTEQEQTENKNLTFLVYYKVPADPEFGHSGFRDWRIYFESNAENAVLRFKQQFPVLFDKCVTVNVIEVSKLNVR